MEAVIHIVFPVFGLVLIGYLFGRVEILNNNNASALNDYVYYIGLPVLLFYQTAKTPIYELLNYPFILAVVCSNLAILFIAFVTGKVLFSHTIERASAFSFSASFSNVGFMGIPLFIAAFGETGTLPAIVMAIISNTVIIGTITILLEIGDKSISSKYDVFKHSMLSLLKSPMLIGSILGILVAALNLQMPLALNNLLSMISQSASPVALFAIGLSMIGLGVRIKMNELISMVMFKLILFPLLTFFIVTYVFVLEKHWAMSAVLLSALPTGAIVFVVCQKYNTYVKESSSVFLVTTLVSTVTLSLLLYIYL